jgi:hypothetical protein
MIYKSHISYDKFRPQDIKKSLNPKEFMSFSQIQYHLFLPFIAIERFMPKSRRKKIKSSPEEYLK